MARVLLHTGSLREYKALGVLGNQVFAAATQLRATIGRQLGPQAAALLAIPQVNESGSSVDWYAPVPGNVVPWLVASVEERQQARVMIAGMIELFNRHSQAMLEELEKNPRQESSPGIFARMLPVAIHIPDESHIYLVNGLPVLVFWGFEQLDAPPGRHILRDLPAGTAPESAETAGSGAEPEPTEQEPAEQKPEPKAEAQAEPAKGTAAMAGATAADAKARPESIFPENTLPGTGTVPASAVPPAPPQEAETAVWYLSRKFWYGVFSILLLLLLLSLVLFGIRACSTDTAIVPPPAAVPAPGSTQAQTPGKTQTPGTTPAPADTPAPAPAPAPVIINIVPVAPAVTAPGTPVPVTPAPGITTVPAPPVAPAITGPATLQESPAAKAAPPAPAQTPASPGKPVDPAAGKPEEGKKEPQPLAIPSGAKDTTFLDGHWSSRSELMDSQTGRPVTMEYSFDKGKGTATIRRSDGSTCQADVTASLKNGALLIDQAKDAVCPDGQVIRRSQVECRAGANGQTRCQGTPDGSQAGEAYTLQMVR